MISQYELFEDYLEPLKKKNLSVNQNTEAQNIQQVSNLFI
jgi:hypothetical protein